VNAQQEARSPQTIPFVSEIAMENYMKNKKLNALIKVEKGVGR
jgi:hypothetical protein